MEDFSIETNCATTTAATLCRLFASRPRGGSYLKKGAVCASRNAESQSETRGDTLWVILVIAIKSAKREKVLAVIASREDGGRLCTDVRSVSGA